MNRIAIEVIDAWGMSHWHPIPTSSETFMRGYFQRGVDAGVNQAVNVHRHAYWEPCTC